MMTCQDPRTWKGQGKGTGNWKGKGAGKKGKGKGTGCFSCGSHSHWSGDCPQKQAGAIVEDAPESKDTDRSWNWNEDWHDDEGWFEDDWTGAVVDDTGWTYDDWSWYESDWKIEQGYVRIKAKPSTVGSQFASVMVKLGFRGCKSDSNLARDLQLQQEFSLGKELLVKITGRLERNTEASFLGRQLRNNGDSVDVFTPSKYIEDLLELYAMKRSSSSPNTGSSSLTRIVDAGSPLTDFQISNCCWQASLVSICEARLFLCCEGIE